MQGVCGDSSTPWLAEATATGHQTNQTNRGVSRCSTLGTLDAVPLARHRSGNSLLRARRWRCSYGLRLSPSSMMQDGGHHSCSGKKPHRGGTGRRPQLRRLESWLRPSACCDRVAAVEAAQAEVSVGRGTGRGSATASRRYTIFWHHHVGHVHLASSSSRYRSSWRKASCCTLGLPRDAVDQHLHRHLLTQVPPHAENLFPASAQARCDPAHSETAWNMNCQ